MAVISQEYEDFIRQFREFDVELLYSLLFPYIQRDFMGKQDCENIHSRSNMQVVVGTDIGSVNHIVYQGGNDTHSQSQLREHEEKVRDGGTRLSQAQETGEF